MCVVYGDAARAAHVQTRQLQTTAVVQEQFDGIKNIRDLAEAYPGVAPGTVCLHVAVGLARPPVGEC